MEYNTDLFGLKQDVYNDSDSTQYLYSVGSINTNLHAGLLSNAIDINTYLPDNIYYWMINSKSPYSRYTLCRRSGNNNNYTWVRESTPENSNHIPMILMCSGFKHNSNTYNIDTGGSGSVGNDYTQIPNRRFTSNMFALSGSVSNPIWYETDNLNAASRLHQNGADFIVDFDYKNTIAAIMVNGSVSGTANDLANYNNTSDNWITSISYKILTGDITMGSRQSTSSQTAYINGVSARSTASRAARVVTDYRYKTADIMDYYQKADFALFKAISSDVHGETIILGNETGTSTTYGVNYYMDDEHWELNDDMTGYRLKKHGDGIYNDDDYDYIRECIAYLGFWFTDGGTYNGINRSDALLGNDANTYTSDADIPDKVYQAEIKDGVTTGKFIELRIAKDNGQSQWGKDWRDKTGYNGRTVKDDKDFGDLTTVLHRGAIAAGCKWYGLTETQLNSLITWMNSGYQPDSNDQFISDFKGVNPAEYITSITYLPFYPISSGTDELINIGPLSTAVTGRKIAYEYGVTVDLGSYTLDRYFNDFRDFKPYTAISLYIPFCGTVELDAANYYGRNINAKLMIDMSTGSCTGLVFANDLLIDTISGQCGVKIPLAAFNMGDYQNAIINAQYQLKQAERQRDNAMIGAAVATIGGAITAGTGIGAVAGAAGALYAVNKMYEARDKISNIEYNIEHMQPKQTNISTASPTNNLGMEYDCRLIITRPTTLDTDINIYGHIVGYMTNKQGVLSDFSGFTQCSNVDLSGIPMTSSELASIHEALKSGVYLP